MEASPQEQQSNLPGKSRIELYNPDGTYYFRADVEPREVRQLQAEKKRRGISFQEVVHEAFMLGPVTNINRLPLILGPREFFSIYEGKRRLQPMPVTKEDNSQPTAVGECPFCGHSLSLTLGPMPTSPQQHSVHFQKAPAQAQQRAASLTVQEAAQVLRTSTHTLRIYCRRGLIHAAKLGREYRITHKEIDRILEEGIVRRKGGRPKKVR